MNLSLLEWCCLEIVVSMSDASKEQQVTIDFEEPESVGLHPRWDPGASGWSKWRKQGHAVGITSSGWRSEEWSDENFALAVSEQPLLDDDALVLRSRGGEVCAAAALCASLVGSSGSLRWARRLDACGAVASSVKQ